MDCSKIGFVRHLQSLHLNIFRCRLLSILLLCWLDLSKNHFCFYVDLTYQPWRYLLLFPLLYSIINPPPKVSLHIFLACAFVHRVQVVKERFTALDKFKIIQCLDYFNYLIIHNQRFFIRYILYFSCIHFIHISYALIQFVNAFWFALFHRPRCCIDVFLAYNLCFDLLRCYQATLITHNTLCKLSC